MALITSDCDQIRYEQFPPAKRLINHLTTVILLNATYTALFFSMVSEQLLQTTEFPLWLRIGLCAIGLVLPFYVILRVVPPTIKVSSHPVAPPRRAPTISCLLRVERTLGFSAGWRGARS